MERIPIQMKALMQPGGIKRMMQEGGVPGLEHMCRKYLVAYFVSLIVDPERGDLIKTFKGEEFLEDEDGKIVDIARIGASEVYGEPNNTFQVAMISQSNMGLIERDVDVVIRKRWDTCYPKRGFAKIFTRLHKITYKKVDYKSHYQVVIGGSEKNERYHQNEGRMGMYVKYLKKGKEVIPRIKMDSEQLGEERLIIPKQHRLHKALMLAMSMLAEDNVIGFIRFIYKM